jgi:polyisoprenoid-binding protein YceI
MQFAADADKSAVEFLAIGRPSALRIVGKGKGATGRLTESSGKAAGEMSFDLNSLDTGITLRDKHMKEKYLETGKFPTAVLKLESFALPKDATAARFATPGIPFTGKLTLHGIERPVSGTADLSRDGETASALASFKIKLTDYGVDIPKFAGITVAEDVDVKVDLHGTITQAAGTRK